jgi:hypothetical protein
MSLRGAPTRTTEINRQSRYAQHGCRIDKPGPKFFNARRGGQAWKRPKSTGMVNGVAARRVDNFSHRPEEADDEHLARL